VDKKQIKAAMKHDAALMKAQMKGGGKVKIDCKKVLCDRLEEAKGALERGYNEQAEFDAAVITMVLELCDDKPVAGAEVNRESKPRAVAGDGVPYADYARKELHDAERYWSDYQSTGKDKFRYIAKQELGHAAAMIEEVEDKGIKAELMGRLRGLEKTIK